jgi:hypothetical protein
MGAVLRDLDLPANDLQNANPGFSRAGPQNHPGIYPSD